MGVPSIDSSLDVTQPKLCNGCGVAKTLSQFSKHRCSGDGLRTRCKACEANAVRNYRAKNTEKVAEYNRRYKAEKAEVLREKARKRQAALRRHAPEAVKALKRQWGATDKGKASKKAWRESNAERERAYGAKRRSTPKGRLENSLRSQVNRSIKVGSKQGRRTFSLLGYTADELKTHLEDQFLAGMGWENYGEWHVDHIRPLASFNYETPEDPDFKEAWTLDNLRPLWALDNIKKGAKWAPGAE